MKAGLLPMQQVMGLVGATGFEPAVPKCRIAVPGWIAAGLSEAVSETPRKPAAAIR